MDGGYIELAELLGILTKLETVGFRMALILDGTEWKLHTLIIEHMPEQEDRVAPAFDMNYGSVHLIAGIVKGETMVAWLHQHAGEITPLGRTGPVRSFALPQLNSKVIWRKIPSHASIDFASMPWPIARYDVTVATAYTLQEPIGFLVADGLPFYPDLKTAILSQIYQASDMDSIRNATISTAVIIRIADTSAWLSKIKLSPTAINVTVFGTRAAGTQVTVSGSGGVQFQQQMQKRGTVECLLPAGIPSPLWIVLSRGSEWLDYYHRDVRWPITNLRQSNVIVEAGDASTEMAALIAQGEDLTTEFKGDVPKERDQMLKTIAAFANGEGGTLLLGVKDKTGELVGYDGDPDHLTQMIRDNVFPEPPINIEAVEVEHRRIVAIHVHKGISPPYGLHATNTHYYVRRGATTFPARPEELRAIVLASQQPMGGPFAGYVI